MTSVINSHSEFIDVVDIGKTHSTESPTYIKHLTQTMALKHLLVLLPFQALLLIAPAGQAYASGTTWFVPDGYRGGTCRALKPGCMTKQQWANYCRKTYPMHHSWPKSCRDAIASHSQTLPEPGTRFLPDDHRGPTCFALSPACMTRSQWAKVCESRNYTVLPKSCRDALGVRPIMPSASLWLRHVLPLSPIRLPNAKTEVTCLALSEACLSRYD